MPRRGSLVPKGGGSNRATHADRTGLEIRVAYYPPYTSKYNPIEHPLFPHLSRACQGVILKTVEQVQHYMSKAATKTGLQVVVTIIDRKPAAKQRWASKLFIVASQRKHNGDCPLRI